MAEFVLQNADRVLHHLASVGKAVAIAAPVPVIFNLLIDSERRAREPDAKCTDLVERVTYVLILLPTLSDIQVDDKVKQAVERTVTAVQTSTATILAYRALDTATRKAQAVGHYVKFASSSDALLGAAIDLIGTMNVELAGLLHRLSRAVPDGPDMPADAVPETDSAVDSFVTHYQVQIDQAVDQHVDPSAVSALRELTKQAVDNPWSAPYHQCRQCGNSIRASENNSKACKYHIARFDGMKSVYPCCGKSSWDFCQTGFHRPTHHSDYPYTEFFEREWQVMYPNSGYREIWAELQDVDMKTKVEQKVSVGSLLRTFAMGSMVDEPTIYAAIGTISPTTKYAYFTWNAKELALASRLLELTNDPVIFRSDPSTEEFVLAEWVLGANGAITGIAVSAKASTSGNALKSIIPINASAQKTGEVEDISKGGVTIYTPETPYVLPKDVVIGGTIPDKPRRAARTDFKSVTTPAFPVVLKPVGAVTANPKLAAVQQDYFRGAISVFNKHEEGSRQSITIANVKAEWRLTGDETYEPVTALKLLDYQELPHTIRPRGSQNFYFEVTVPRTEADTAANVQWWNRAFVARQRPLRLKVTIEEMEGEEASLVMEYVIRDFKPDPRKDEDIYFPFVDDTWRWQRYGVHIQAGTEKDVILKVEGKDLTQQHLSEVAFQALESGETEVDLKIGEEKDLGWWEWAAYAHVDISCNRVYALKIVIKHGQMAKQKKVGGMFYIPVPDYGTISAETRPMLPAIEWVEIGKLTGTLPPDGVTDDAFDDHVAVPAPAPPPATAVPAAALSESLSLLGLGGSASSITPASPAIPPPPVAPSRSTHGPVANQNVAPTGVPSDAAIQQLGEIQQQLKTILDNQNQYLPRIAQALEQLVLIMGAPPSHR